MTRVPDTTEFLHIPAPRTKYASQFGHLCRMLSLYQNLESALGRFLGYFKLCVLFFADVLEMTLEITATKEGIEKAHAIADLRKKLDVGHPFPVSLSPLIYITNGLNSCTQVWLSTLPDHLRFSEDSLEKQISMFETSSNTGAWCYCFMHVLHPCFVLSLTDVRCSSSSSS